MSEEIPIIDRNRIRSSMMMPSGSSPYFGWLTEDGLMFTVSIDDVIAVYPSGRSDLMCLQLRGGPEIRIPTEHGLRMMKRMGWKEEDMRTKLSR